MANSLSPAISVNEVDLTNVVPSVQSSTGALVGNFNWGPVEDPQLIDNEGTLASTYGTPVSTNAVDFLSAAQFLKYSSRLYVNRVVDSAAKNAVSSTSTPAGIPIKNDTVHENTTYTASTGVFLAKFPGALGNSLLVSVCPAGATFSTWNTAGGALGDWDLEFASAPGSSPWLLAQGDSDGQKVNDEVHVLVIDKKGLFTGVPGTVLERFPYLSVALGAKTSDGGTNYWVDVINNASNFIRFGYKDTNESSIIGDNTNAAVPLGTPIDYSDGISWTPASSDFQMTLGTNSGALATDTVAAGFDAFEDTDTITVDLLIAPGMPGNDNAAGVTAQNTVVADLVATCAVIRKDCIAISSPSRPTVINNANVVDDTTAWAADALSASSYLVVDNNYLKIFDKYNDQFVWVPAASTTAGIMAATDLTQGPWFSPAGQKRGQYFGVVDIAYNASKSQRDELYALGVNPIVNLPGRGITLYGDKTRESRPSAFDRINVRRLFLNIERAISIAARGVMFEFNDEFTRAEFVNVIEPYLREIKGRRGITDFAVQCDETNNTPAVIDRNELIASIFVKPARSINFVTLNFVAVRTGVNFEEVVGTV